MVQHKQIPQLPKVPLLGHLRALRADPFQVLRRVAEECGAIGMFYAGPVPVVLVTSLPYIHTVLVDRAADFEKSPMLRRYLRPVLGNGLLSSQNQVHKRQRTLVAPAFQPTHIASYAQIISDSAEQLQASWPHNAQIDIHQEMQRLTLRIVGKTLFDTELLSDADGVARSMRVIAAFAEDMATALLHVPYSWPTPRHQRTRRAIADLDALIARLVVERQAVHAPRHDVLSILLQAHDADNGTFMTPTQLRDELMTLFIAGHDTTATALGWTWVLLAHHPACYARARREAQQALGGRTPTGADLAQLPYTLAVIKEALRLYPPAWIILRQAACDTAIDGYPIRRGTRVAVSPYVLHRTATYFPDPERFDPERWLHTPEPTLPRHAYLPFGAGPRVCIGNHFALLMLNLTLATLLQRVVFEPRSAYPPVHTRPTFQPVGMTMHVRRLKDAGSQ